MSLEAGCSEFVLDSLTCELRADLDPQPFIGFELDVDFELIDSDSLPVERAEADVHPFFLGVPERLEGEGLLGKVSAEVPVHDDEGITHESLRDPGAIPICGSDQVRALDEIDAEQEPIFRTSCLCDSGE